MDCEKVGKLIFKLRKEKNMTQKQLAQTMNISDKTISKWERGMGCPDISVLHQLSDVLNVDIEKILLGDLEPNISDAGNLKRIKIYVCPACGNILTSSSSAYLSCCGRKLSPLKAKQADNNHTINIEVLDNECYITIPHEMEKSHYISFIIFISDNKIILERLYPEQSSETRFPKLSKGSFYFFCSKHGLWKK